MNSSARFHGSANLDLLRTLAVLLVLACHVLLFFGLIHRGDFFWSIGSWGVLLFFVHTSTVLMMSIERQIESGAARPYVTFLLRRVFRIYPLSVTTVAAVVLLRLPLGQFEDGHFLAARLDWPTVLSNLLLVQNITGSGSVLNPL